MVDTNKYKVIFFMPWPAFVFEHVDEVQVECVNQEKAERENQIVADSDQSESENTPKEELPFEEDKKVVNFGHA